MRKIIVSMFVSLDGVVENPAWTFPYWNDEMAKFKATEDDNTDALLLGRVTYDGFAAAWPQSEDEGAPWMNSVKKYVVSNNLSTAEWNNTSIIQGDVVAEIKKIKAQDGQDILVYGSPNLLKTLMENDLVDQYNLQVYPVVLGSGKRMFADGVDAKLKLVESQVLSTGVTVLIYQPDRS